MDGLIWKYIRRRGATKARRSKALRCAWLNNPFSVLNVQWEWTLVKETHDNIRGENTELLANHSSCCCDSLFRCSQVPLSSAEILALTLNSARNKCIKHLSPCLLNSCCFFHFMVMVCVNRRTWAGNITAEQKTTKLTKALTLALGVKSMPGSVRFNKNRVEAISNISNIAPIIGLSCPKKQDDGVCKNLKQ